MKKAFIVLGYLGIILAILDFLSGHPALGAFSAFVALIDFLLVDIVP